MKVFQTFFSLQRKRMGINKKIQKVTVAPYNQKTNTNILKKRTHFGIYTFFSARSPVWGVTALERCLDEMGRPLGDKIVTLPFFDCLEWEHFSDTKLEVVTSFFSLFFLFFQSCFFLFATILLRRFCRKILFPFRPIADLLAQQEELLQARENHAAKMIATYSYFGLWTNDLVSSINY